MPAISNPQSAASSEFKQVWEVRIPDPDCKSILPQFDPFCRNVVIPVRDSKVQSSLWKFDADHNHVLDAYDVSGDTDTRLSGGVAARLAQLLTGTQYADGGQLKFTTAESILNYARASIAIDRAHDTVQFLQGLPSHHVNSGHISNEHEFNASDWEKIVTRLGVGGKGYADQVQAAYAGIEAFMESAKMLALTLTHNDCDPRGNCRTVHDAWVIDPTPLPSGMREEFAHTLLKLAAVEAFALNDEIECEGSGCPSDSESPNPLDGHYHGGKIAMRMDDTADGKVVFLQLSAPFKWSNTPNHTDYLPELLASMTFTPTSVSK